MTHIQALAETPHQLFTVCPDNIEMPKSRTYKPYGRKDIAQNLAKQRTC